MGCIVFLLLIFMPKRTSSGTNAIVFLHDEVPHRVGEEFSVRWAASRGYSGRRNGSVASRAPARTRGIPRFRRVFGSGFGISGVSTRRVFHRGFLRDFFSGSCSSFRHAPPWHSRETPVVDRTQLHPQQQQQQRLPTLCLCSSPRAHADGEERFFFFFFFFLNSGSIHQPGSTATTRSVTGARIEFFFCTQEDSRNISHPVSVASRSQHNPSIENLSVLMQFRRFERHRSESFETNI